MIDVVLQYHTRITAGAYCASMLQEKPLWYNEKKVQTSYRLRHKEVRLAGAGCKFMTSEHKELQRSPLKKKKVKLHLG